MSTPDQIHAWISQYVAGLQVPASLRRPGAESFQEATEPLMPEWEPATRAHLSFFVDDRETEDIDGFRNNAAEGMWIRVPAVVRVLFEVRLGTENAREDWRQSARLASWLLGQIAITEWVPDPDTVCDFMIEAGPRPFRRAPLRDNDGEQGWLAIEIRFFVRYPLTFEEMP